MKCIHAIHCHLPFPFNATSCTHVNGSQIETVKYLINKGLFVYSNFKALVDIQHLIFLNIFST